MNRRQLIKNLVSIGSVSMLSTSNTGCSTSNLSEETTNKSPNFIVIISDDVSQRHIGAYGNGEINTPNIDSIAKNGMLFNNAYLVAASCTASRASYLTSRYPHNHGAPEINDWLPSSQLTLPAILKNHGYYTVHMGKSHIGEHIKNDYDLFLTDSLFKEADSSSKCNSVISR